MTSLTWTQRYYAPAVSKLPSAEPDTFADSELTYPSLAAFVRADVRRLRGRERDVGLRWREGADDRVYRAAWNEGTGELYVVQTGTPREGGGHVEVLALARTVDELEAALGGWRLVCGEKESLEWLRHTARERLAPAAPKGRKARFRAQLQPC